MVVCSWASPARVAPGTGIPSGGARRRDGGRAQVTSLLDPETDGIPGAAEQAGLGNILENGERDRGNRGTGGGAHQQRADALSLGQRRDEGVGALDARL